MAYCEYCDHCNADLMDGANIREVRKAQGITLRRMATNLGITPTYLCDIEYNRRRTHIANGIGAKIAAYLRLQPEVSHA